ncbi:TPA: hypothetical protein ACMFP1_002912 [Pseudomonas aeruginosa]|uniref:Uncharacterized protein n=1 Tax=Pseudomonas phage PA_L9 TaxID=3232177 RepID=A0AAU8KYJ4_9CAUD|nr:hypothetical protein UFRH6_8 [Pseudomonas phage UF_RH6]HBO9768529.1 hypothetical protein [Pseudomonas aeruginosa]
MADTIITDYDEVLDLLENDLKTKIIRAMQRANIQASVVGVFSLDELEQRTESDMAMGNVVFGVAYQGCKPGPDMPERTNPAHTNGAGFADFLFSIIIGGKVDTWCSQRGFVARILTLLRKEIYQSDVQTGKRPEAVRVWNFVQERPEIADSSSDMLYYSQVWKLNLPLKSLK